MARDRLINVILTAQVLLTIALTGWLWLFPFGQQSLPAERAKVTQVSPGGFVSIPALVRPAEFIVHFPDGTHGAAPDGTFAYDGLWEELRGMLASIVRPADWQPDSGTELEAAWGKVAAIDVRLAGALGMSEWVQQWGGSVGESPNAHMRVNRITLVLGPAPALYFFGPDGSWRGPGLTGVQQEGLLRWLQRVDRKDLILYRAFKAPADINATPGLFVPAEPPAINPPRLKVKQPQPHDLETGLFPDLSVVREIAEGNGAVMYTDGQKYLRLNPDGSVDYQAPEPPSRARAPALGRALTLAAEFVAEHGGWPPELMLTGAAQSDGRTVLQFARSVGPGPVVGTAPLLRVELSSDRVVAFYRALNYTELLYPVPAPGDRAIDPETALAAWRGRTQGAGLHDLRDVYFAYVYRRGVLTPAWCFQVADARVVMVNARTGEPL